jgi:hypothetical protein
VSGGVTWVGVLDERNGIGGVNMGGGLTYWLGREGVRIEFREVVFNNGSHETEYWTARIGISFR